MRHVLMRHVLPAALVFALASATFPAHAQGRIAIYRCTDASGALTIQNDVPCPKGSRQDKRAVDVPPPMPAYRPVPAAPAPVLPKPPVLTAAAAETSEPAIADADRLPPPALYRCNTYDNDSYLSEDAEPPPRCVRMETVGLDGSTDGGAGVACQMVTDQCERVADGAVCDAWKQRLRETQATWKFTRADDAEASKADYERVDKIMRESTCGK